ncbi:MAG: type II secretion system protein [Kiritimatiellae bacterium]|nr:type II secretion system protein [Kiritimatiellia bacterium]
MCAAERTRKAFTIVELMMVVAVIAVLTTIVTTAATNAMRSAREKRRDAMRVALQAAIATYQASDSQGRWPGALENAAENGRTVVLGEEEAQRVFRIIVQKSTGESGTPIPLIDPHGLFVAPSGAVDGKSSGMPYDDARRGDAHRRRKFPVSGLVFGYQGRVSGKFYRYNIIYHAATDSVSVHACCTRCLSPGSGGCGNSNCQHCHRGER